MPAGCSIKALHAPVTAYTVSSSHGGMFVYIFIDVKGHAWGMWTIDMAPRQGNNQRSSARSTSVQVMSAEKEQAFFFFVCFKTTKRTRKKYLFFTEMPAF